MHLRRASVLQTRRILSFGKKSGAGGVEDEDDDEDEDDSWLSSVFCRLASVFCRLSSVLCRLSSLVAAEGRDVCCLAQQRTF